MNTLITVDDVKPYLPIRAGNTAYDVKIGNLINNVTRMIGTACNRQFEYAQRDEYHNPKNVIQRKINLTGDSWGLDYSDYIEADDQIIVLGASPVDDTQPVTVWYDPSRQFTDTCHIVDPSYYVVDTENNRLLLRYPTRAVLRSLKVTYSAGYQVDTETKSMSAALDELAPDLKQAAITATIHLWNRSDPENLGTQEAGHEDGRKYSKPNSYGLPQETLAMIAPYKRALVGRR